MRMGLKTGLLLGLLWLGLSAVSAQAVLYIHEEGGSRPRYETTGPEHGDDWRHASDYNRRYYYYHPYREDLRDDDDDDGDVYVYTIPSFYYGVPHHGFEREHHGEHGEHHGEHHHR